MIRGVLTIERWWQFSLVHFNKIQQLDIRDAPRYDKYTYQNEHLIEAKKMNGNSNNDNDNNDNNNVGFYGVLSTIMEKNFTHLTSLTFYENLSIALHPWKLYIHQ